MLQTFSVLSYGSDMQKLLVKLSIFTAYKLWDIVTFFAYAKINKDLSSIYYWVVSFLHFIIDKFWVNSANSKRNESNFTFFQKATRMPQLQLLESPSLPFILYQVHCELWSVTESLIPQVNLFMLQNLINNRFL